MMRRYGSPGFHGVGGMSVADLGGAGCPGGAVPWYLSGGIAPANCLIAYTAKGASSLAASYDNNAAPGNGLADGTYDATLGVAPTWAAATGWTFDGLAQYLITGLNQAQNYTYIISCSGLTTVGGVIFGSRGDPRIYFQNNAGGAGLYAWGSTTANGTAGGGVYAMANNACYFNGGFVANVGGGWVGVNLSPSAVGCLSRIGGVYNTWCAGVVTAVAVYNVVLDAPTIAALSAAMAAL